MKLFLRIIAVVMFMTLGINASAQNLIPIAQGTVERYPAYSTTYGNSNNNGRVGFYSSIYSSCYPITSSFSTTITTCIPMWTYMATAQAVVEFELPGTTTVDSWGMTTNNFTAKLNNIVQSSEWGTGTFNINLFDLDDASEDGSISEADWNATLAPQESSWPQTISHTIGGTPATFTDIDVTEQLKRDLFGTGKGDTTSGFILISDSKSSDYQLSFDLATSEGDTDGPFIKITVKNDTDSMTDSETTDTDSDTVIIIDTDSMTDSETTDTDSDTVIIIDTDSMTDSDSDSAVDTDTAADSDSAVDTDTPADSDSAVDTDTAADSDSAVDTDPPADSDSAVDTDPPADSDTVDDSDSLDNSDTDSDNSDDGDSNSDEGCGCSTIGTSTSTSFIQLLFQLIF